MVITKKKLAYLRIVGGLTAVSGLVYGNYYGKIGYLFSSIGFLILTGIFIINEASAPTKH